MTRSGKGNRRRHSGSSPSENQHKTTPAAADRNNLLPAKGVPASPMTERSFDMVVDGDPYSVRSIPFLFNNELRYRVCINGKAEHLLAWDSQVNMLRAIDDESSNMPSVLEEALSERLR